MSRLLRFIPGLTLYEVDTWTSEHFYQCGQFVAKMDLSLQTFRHPGPDINLYLQGLRTGTTYGT